MTRLILLAAAIVCAGPFVASGYLGLLIAIHQVRELLP